LFEELTKNGYSRKDIVDLCELYELQLHNFVNIFNKFSSKELIDELHKLKGGASILSLDNSVVLLSELMRLNQTTSRIKPDIIFNAIREIQIELKLLKQAALNTI
jgi:hypothetical protein